jgi:hypothetical protein
MGLNSHGKGFPDLLFVSLLQVWAQGFEEITILFKELFSLHFRV